MTPARLDTLCDQARAAVAECVARAAAHHAVQIAIAFDGARRRAAWRTCATDAQKAITAVIAATDAFRQFGLSTDMAICTLAALQHPPTKE